MGDAVLDPGFSTNVTERILYAVYDVTDMIADMDQAGHEFGDLRGKTNNSKANKSIVFGARVGAGKYSYVLCERLNHDCPTASSTAFERSFEIMLSPKVLCQSFCFTRERCICPEVCFNGSFFERVKRCSSYNKQAMDRK